MALTCWRDINCIVITCEVIIAWNIDNVICIHPSFHPLNIQYTCLEAYYQAKHWVLLSGSKLLEDTAARRLPSCRSCVPCGACRGSNCSCRARSKAREQTIDSLYRFCSNNVVLLFIIPSAKSFIKNECASLLTELSQRRREFWNEATLFYWMFEQSNFL